ncbi:MAG: dihydroorotate oxidase, partial [Treponema sp.]|nr:dihydroorotate oxidase [Treponema sp.]
MADLKTKLCGVELDSPFVLGSGPAGWDAESLAACARAGAGAVVTKSIAVKAFVNDSRHMI